MMGLAENLLDTLSNPSISLSTEEEPHIIVGDDRRIIVPQKLQLIAVTGDKNVETVTIDCVRYWDEYDLSNFSLYINYTLPNGEDGTYVPKNLKVYNDYFSFDWQIESIFTKYEGTLTFWIVAKDVDEEEIIQHQWSSLKNSDMRIAKGGDEIYVPETPDELDLLSQALQRANEALNKANETNEIISKFTSEVWTFTLDDGTILEKKVVIEQPEFEGVIKAGIYAFNETLTFEDYEEEVYEGFFNFEINVNSATEGLFTAVCNSFVINHTAQGDFASVHVINTIPSISLEVPGHHVVYMFDYWTGPFGEDAKIIKVTADTTTDSENFARWFFANTSRVG